MSKTYAVLKNANPGVDIHIAVFLAECAQAAYDEVTSPEAWATAAGFAQVHSFNRRNVQGFWCVQDGVALLAFRGTSNIGQWLRDARFFPGEFPWGRVHVGFRDGVDAVSSDLKAFAKAAAGANSVWVTGHSLGGALAVIAAARLRMMTPTPLSASLYTYGQPRVGLSGFASEFDTQLPQRLVRFINHSDIVPRVPPDPIYHHGGLGKRIVGTGVLELAPAPRALEMEAAPDERSESLQRALSGPAGAAAQPETAAARSIAATGTMLADGDLPSLTPEQFAELQFGLGASPNDGVGRSLGAPSRERAVARAESIPDFSDHAIKEYVRYLTEIEARGG
jgi:hypothetical protein